MNYLKILIRDILCIDNIRTYAFVPNLDIKSFIKDRNERIRCQKLNREREVREREEKGKIKK